MPASSDRIEFTPPDEPGVTRAFVLAVAAHLLLMAALTWGISWNRDKENLAAEAELWASTPQQAAPKLAEPPPPPPVPEPPRQVETPPPPPVEAPKAPDITLEQEKQRKALARQKQVELDRQKKLEARQMQEQHKREQLAARKEAEERKRRDADLKTAKTRKQQQEEEKRREALHDAQVARMQGLAGATGGPNATGTAQRSAGPSDSYAGRVRARVKPNIVFTDDIAGNPSAEVEVRLAPDGTILSSRIVKSSGFKSWDDAVVRALVKTEVLPRDADGRVPTPLTLVFKPKD